MSEKRKCIAVIGDEKREGVFHGWSHYATVLEPSLMRGGHAGGQISETYAIIEGLDGKVFRCVPEKVVFVPEKVYPGGGCDYCRKYAVSHVMPLGNRDGLGAVKAKYCFNCGRRLPKEAKNET